MLRAVAHCRGLRLILLTHYVSFRSGCECIEVNANDYRPQVKHRLEKSHLSRRNETGELQVTGPLIIVHVLQSFFLVLS